MDEPNEEMQQLAEQVAEIKDMSMENLVKSLLKSVQQNAEITKQHAELLQRLNNPAPADLVAARAEKISKETLPGFRRKKKIMKWKFSDFYPFFVNDV